MPPGADWWEVAGFGAAVLLTLYRARLLVAAFEDWIWVRKNRIGNGRRVLAEGHRRAQGLRLLCDLAILAVIGHAMTEIASERPGDLGIWIERVGVVLIPLSLLGAAVLEAQMRAALMHELDRAHVAKDERADELETANESLREHGLPESPPVET